MEWRRRERDLEVFPGFGDGERAVLLDDVEDGAANRLYLFRRHPWLDRLHLRFRLLRHPPGYGCEHLLPYFSSFSPNRGLGCCFARGGEPGLAHGHGYAQERTILGRWRLFTIFFFRRLAQLKRK